MLVTWFLRSFAILRWSSRGVCMCVCGWEFPRPLFSNQERKEEEKEMHCRLVFCQQFPVGSSMHHPPREQRTKSLRMTCCSRVASWTQQAC